MFLHPSFLPRTSHNLWNSQVGQTQLVLLPVEELLQLALPNASRTATARSYLMVMLSS